MGVGQAGSAASSRLGRLRAVPDLAYIPAIEGRAPSYSHGGSDTPLLGETIGENLRRTVENFGDREALVSTNTV